MEFKKNKKMKTKSNWLNYTWIHVNLLIIVVNFFLLISEFEFMACSAIQARGNETEITNVSSMISQMPSYSAMLSFNGVRNTNKINKQMIINCDEKNNFCSRSVVFTPFLPLSLHLCLIFVFSAWWRRKKPSNNLWHAQSTVKAQYLNCVIWM